MKLTLVNMHPCGLKINFRDKMNVDYPLQFYFLFTFFRTDPNESLSHSVKCSILLTLLILLGFVKLTLSPANATYASWVFSVRCSVT